VATEQSRARPAAARADHKLHAAAHMPSGVPDACGTQTSPRARVARRRARRGT